MVNDKSFTGPHKIRSYVYDLHYQIRWETWHQQPVLTPAMQAGLRQRLNILAPQHAITLEALTMDASQVELQVSAPPKISVTVMVKILKGVAGKWLLLHFPNIKSQIDHHHLWSPTTEVRSIALAPQWWQPVGKSPER